MSILKFLQLQTIDPSDDGTVSPFDEYNHDETIDLSADFEDISSDGGWMDELNSDPEKLTFHD